MTHSLDRPVWNALTTSHAALAEGDGRAWRYPGSVVPFAAAQDYSPEHLAALGAMLRENDVMAIVEAGPVAVPAGVNVLFEGKIVQMAAAAPAERIIDPRITELTEADAEDMLALAQLTKPGPFTLRAQALGTFWGLKIDGRLAAMAGQRMRMPGYAELSGLCTHPDFQRRGFGELLFRFVAGEISARGEIAFLHAYAHNTSAIALYERLGFAHRAEMNLRLIKRAE